MTTSPDDPLRIRSPGQIDRLKRPDSSILLVVEHHPRIESSDPRRKEAAGGDNGFQTNPPARLASREGARGPGGQFADRTHFRTYSLISKQLTELPSSAPSPFRTEHWPDSDAIDAQKKVANSNQAGGLIDSLCSGKLGYPTKLHQRTTAKGVTKPMADASTLRAIVSAIVSTTALICLSSTSAGARDPEPIQLAEDPGAFSRRLDAGLLLGRRPLDGPFGRGDRPSIDLLPGGRRRSRLLPGRRRPSPSSQIGAKGGRSSGCPPKGGLRCALTSHSEGFRLEGWYPDGEHLLVNATRDHFWRNAERFFKIDADEPSAETSCSTPTGPMAPSLPMGRNSCSSARGFPGGGRVMKGPRPARFGTSTRTPGSLRSSSTPRAGPDRRSGTPRGTASSTLASTMAPST